MKEVLAAGNYFGLSPYHGRLGSLAGNIITVGGAIFEREQLGLDFTQKAVSSLDILTLDGVRHLLVTYNNEKPEIYKLKLIDN